MDTNYSKISLACDYQKGAHPEILKRLCDLNGLNFTGYGLDDICKSAADKIRLACNCKNAEVKFLVGGTQTNSTVIDALLKSYQGVISAETGHINVHEAGTVEHSGHKVITLPHKNGKIEASKLAAYLEDFFADDNHEHASIPGMVYISHPTEYGSLYTKSELEELRAVCDAYKLYLYLDGARLAYALACEDNDVSLPDLANLTDAFYIGGTKCGALFGEAVVIPKPETIAHFFSIIKQHGALLAKGWLPGLQFDVLFTDNLYVKIAEKAILNAGRIRKALREKTYHILYENPTNQIFIVMKNEELEALGKKVSYSFWEKYDEDKSVIRLVTDWSTTEEEVEALIRIF